MTEVLIAAAPGEAARARAIADALTAVGFEAAAEVPSDSELAKGVEDAKCVLTLWSGEASATPWLAAQATLALERKKLICGELERGATPNLFGAAPRIDLRAGDRRAFKDRFEALITEIQKLTTTVGKIEALPDALAKARAALLEPARQRARPWTTLGAFVIAVALLFGIGFGVGRVMNAVRAGEFAFEMPKFSLPEPTRREPEKARTTRQAEAPPPVAAALAPRDMETWRDTAARIDEAAAADIRARAERGDADAQALACLAHLTGAGGFLPSPTAALAQCDAAAGQGNLAGLYYSWVLRRNAPQVSLSEADARGRLARAAASGWVSAQIDYALVLAPNARAPIADQTEAGRLWLAAAERGDPRGQFYYARWLRDSPAGPRDPTAAIPFLERASERDQADALHMLATFYRDGVGVARDTTRARALYQRAAAQSHAPSMFNLADLLRDGPTEDRARAVTLYQRLACMPDERQIQPRAVQRLRALREPVSCG